jgi:hypothetical protein
MTGFIVRWMGWFLLASLVFSTGFFGRQAQGLSPVQIQLPRPTIVLAERHDRSLPLREMKASPALQGLPAPDSQLHNLPRSGGGNEADKGGLASFQATGSMPAPIIQWDGLNNTSAVVPPDTNGDVGPNHYVQWVNLSLAIWDKSGNLVYGPVAGNTLWSGFGAPCQNTNYGDPIVLYDPLADRWFASQFVVPTGGPYYQCIAVSATPDPTGVWNRYAFLWSSDRMNDYPKFGVWPDGYYMSVNQFFYGNSWAGGGVAVFERDAMLKGQEARMVSFDLYNVDINFGGMLPADLDGRQAPPPGAPNVFAEWDDSSVFNSVDALRLWNFHVDWNNPGNSTFGINFQPNQVIPTLDVDPDYTNPVRIPQKGTATLLDAISDRLMFRLQYRNFGDFQTLVSNHTVNASSSGTGIHWFELRKTASTDWSLAQENVFAPDANSRWMGSIAMDNSGDIALGYSLSGPDVYPSIAYAGRLTTDPAGELAQSEATMISGGGAQLTSLSRWGDYSMMAVDPSDECTFWYTQEYYTVTSYIGWRTRIGAFKFPSCSQPDSGILQGTVHSAIDAAPILGAQVNAGGSLAFTGPDGTYQMRLPVGTVDVQVSAFGYQGQTLPAEIVKDQSTKRDFSLAQAEMALVSGTVTDGSGHLGMPLYARIEIPGVPVSPVTTDPYTGQYQVILEQGSSYDFTVTAVKGGYLAENRAVIPQAGGSQEDFNLGPDPAACPPGYQAVSGVCQSQNGGLIEGFIRDANNPPNPIPISLPGAIIKDDFNGTKTTTTSDSSGYFILFTPEGSSSISASYPSYADQTVLVSVNADQVTGLTFDLLAGFLQVAPGSVDLSVNKLATTAETNLNFTNQGNAPATFTLAEFNGTPPDLTPGGPFAPAGRRLSPTRLNALTAEKVYEYVPPAAPAWPGGGSTVRSWATGLAAPWGVGLDASGRIWVSDALSGGGDGQDHLFDPLGGGNGGAIPTTWGGDFAADMAYDPQGSRLWQINAGGDNCIYELDPVQQKATGGRICPAFGNPQRGLAYDPRSQTFYSGTWNDAILTHFDRAGTILDSVITGINIAGLAYQPDSGHLYVLSNASVGFDIYVLDPRQGYAILGGFDVPGLTDFGQAGMEFAPDGSLWLADTLGRHIFQVDSGEAPFSPMADVPWLAESLSGATLPGGGSQPVTVSVNGTGLLPGTYQAYLTVTTDTPYDITPYKIDPIPVTLTVLAIHGVALSPDSQAGVAAAGKEVVYTIRVTNNGDFVESYTISTGAHAWQVSLPPTLNNVATGATVELQVTVTVPPATPIGQFEQLSVTVRSSSDPSAVQTVTLTTIAGRALYFPFAGR